MCKVIFMSTPTAVEVKVWLCYVVSSLFLGCDNISILNLNFEGGPFKDLNLLGEQEKIGLLFI